MTCIVERVLGALRECDVEMHVDPNSLLISPSFISGCCDDTRTGVILAPTTGKLEYTMTCVLEGHISPGAQTLHLPKNRAITLLTCAPAEYLARSPTLTIPQRRIITDFVRNPDVYRVSGITERI